MRPRTLALAGLAMAALSTFAFLLLDEPARAQVERHIAFGNETRILSERQPDPVPHAFAVRIPAGALDARLTYFYQLAADERPGGQERPINVVFSLMVDGELGTDGENRADLRYGRSSNTLFVHGWRSDVDLTPGFHVVQMRIDTTDSMTESWEWTFTAQKAEVHYTTSTGWRGGPLPLVGLIVGLAASVALCGWAVKRAVQVPEPPV